MATPAPEPAPGVFLTADCLAHQPKQRLAPRRMPLLPARGCRSRRSSLRRRSRHPACPLTAARAASQPGRRRTQPAILSTAATNPRLGATFLLLSGDTSGNATEDAAAIAIRSHGAAAPLPIYCRSTTSCRSPRAAARTCSITSSLLCPSQLAPRQRVGCAAGSPHLAPPPRCWRARSTRLADGLQVDVAGRDTLRIAARRAHNLRRRIIRPWPWSPVYEPPASGDRHHRQRSALQHR